MEFTNEADKQIQRKCISILALPCKIKTLINLYDRLISQSFERVVVQNILHGLSPSLCKAVQSVSRWKVVQAAFPHLMHACSSLVAACKQVRGHLTDSLHFKVE